MRTIIALFLLTLVACQSEQQPNNNQESTSKKTEPTNTANRANTEQPSFSELPLLAIYINEIGINNEEFGAGENIEFVLEGSELILKNADELRFELNNDQNIVLEEMWSGTSGEGSNEYQYQLLANTQLPTLAVLTTVSNSDRNSTVMQEDARDLAEDLKQDYPNLDIDFDEVAWNMVQRDDLMTGYLQPFNYANYDANISILQKQDNKWIDITNKTFPLDFAKQMELYCPIFDTHKEAFSISLKPLSQQIVDPNKATFEHWSVHIGLSENQIIIGDSENPPVILSWDGQQYQYKKFPKQVFSLEKRACPQIDYTSNKTYTFKGTIAGEEVQMDVKFSIVKAGETPTVKMTGEYFYTKNKSKMPVEGTFSTNIENKISFSRLKKGKARESFDGWFSSCEIKGWWQHLERLTIDEFSLKLVE